MSSVKLFPREKVVGIFRGFSEGGLEFHADIVLPYRNEFQSIPMHGQFLLVQLAHEDEAVLGRITSFFSDGRLASGSGEDYGLRVVQEDRAVPEDLREQYLKYRVNIRVLGVLRNCGEELVFAASHRRLPHVGSKVAFPSDDVLREIVGHNVKGAAIGFFALGEFIYAAGDKRLEVEPWMQPVQPVVVPKFDIAHIVSRRSFVFARAGFGKSNLNKLLFSNLYKETPTVEKRGGRRVPVGTVIFDPDGEYFWPDEKGRPGLCDVPELEDKVVVFTRKQGPSPFYRSFVAGDIKLDIRRLRPSDVVSIALSPEKQDQQNVRKLKGLSPGAWEELVNEIDQHRNQTDLADVKRILHLDDGSEAEAVAARSNMTTIVALLHSRSSQLMDMLLAALRQGKLCIIDVSQMRGSAALILSGLILQRIFDNNQEEFTKADPATIPTIAVIEEAQSVLGGASGSSGEGPYVTWVKEGRKYDLGAVLVTQQPGSITTEILSQGDNWFIFHLLSSVDLQTLRKANAHFSEDILSALLNEPIPGHGVFWSSVGGKPYPIPLRVLSFEHGCDVRDPDYNKGPGRTYATLLREQFQEQLATAVADQPSPPPPPGPAAMDDVVERVPSTADDQSEQPVLEIDVLETYRRHAIEQLKRDVEVRQNMDKYRAMPWMAFQSKIEHSLPAGVSDRGNFAFQLVPRALNELFGKDAWEREKRQRKGGAPGDKVTWIVLK
jgi:uncharacterized protein DUF87